jgi:hypothetical protein
LISLLTAAAEEGVAAAVATLRLNGRMAILQTRGFPLQSQLLGCLTLGRPQALFPATPTQ